MTAPEMPHADLIAELRKSADGLEYLSDSPWVRVMLNRAANALAALGDTVPASTLDKVTASYDEALREARLERDQARQMLADAPHADDCTFLTYEPNSCTCWKAGL
jgi:hypothetical protein